MPFRSTHLLRPGLTLLLGAGFLPLLPPLRAEEPAVVAAAPSHPLRHVAVGGLAFDYPAELTDDDLTRTLLAPVAASLR